MKIYAPNIHLFAFQLQKISNSHASRTEPENVIQLWESADKIVRTTLEQDLYLGQHIDINKEPENPRVELRKESEVKDDDYSIPFAGKISLSPDQKLVIEGFAFPLRMYDSYGLCLNLRRPEKEDDGIRTQDVDISLLSKFNQNHCLILNQNNFFIGQTLLITAWVSDHKDKNKIAEECLTAVFPSPSQRPPFHREGELFRSPIFEYGLFSQIKTYQHVLIWLFTNKQTDNNFNECYQDLLDLFFFRAKAVKAYQDSREIYHQLALEYEEIEKIIDGIPKNKSHGDSETLKSEDLKKFKEQLKSLPQLSVKYTRLLRNLDEYQNTISINSENYASKLRKMSSKIGDDLRFLKTFSEESSPFFQKQITSDLGYFKHGSTLLEQAVAAIRGLVEIEQAERDRSLEQTIQVIGVGLGAGAIVSGIVAAHIDKPCTSISSCKAFPPIILSLFWSVLAVLVFGGIAWLWTKRNKI
ncbi:MAG: hypothetical protein DSM106950_27575 [Stigonema ocellatum SAG 48.90 = DSM 106950]|nr:hypothetical protein [Stigonema ocellatum SAG 48.90 = DSM 106950]